MTLAAAGEPHGPSVRPAPVCSHNRAPDGDAAGPFLIQGGCWALPHASAQNAFVREAVGVYREVADAALTIPGAASRRFAFQVPHTVSLTELADVTAGPVHAVQVWPSAVALADYLLGGSAPGLAGARVHELGCGWALPAFAAALLGAKQVICSDLPDVVASLSLSLPSDLPQIEVKPWDWNERSFATSFCGARKDTLDLALCADCIYAPLYPPAALVGALVSLRATRTLLAVERRPADGCEATLASLACEGLDGHLAATYGQEDGFMYTVEIWQLELDGLQGESSTDLDVDN